MAVIVRTFAELQLFVVKMHSEEGLAVGNNRVVTRGLAGGFNTVKQALVLIIDLLIESGELRVPGIGLGDVVDQLAPVGKVVFSFKCSNNITQNIHLTTM